MIKILPFIAFSLFITFASFGQQLHTPDQVIQLMLESSVTYAFDSLKTDIPQISYANQGQQSKQIYRIDNPTEIKLEVRSRPSFQGKSSKRLKKGNKNLEANNAQKARNYFMPLYEENISNTYIINKVAQTYFKEKNYGTAAFWYERSIEYNYIDTEARRKAAVCYLELGNNQKAVEQISLAHFFNRNDQEILDELKSIFSTSGYVYKDYQFNPHYNITKEADKKIKIEYGHSVWAAYAAVLALWEYEPSYNKSMKKISNQEKKTVQTKEALLNALITYEHLDYSQKVEQFPLIELLKEISLEQQIDNFVIYEILSREDPLLIMKLEKEKIEDLIQYLIEVR